MPNNQTSVSMKRKLAMALKKRLAAAPPEKITIKELTDDCGVNRQTFYYHFQDIYNLLKWLFHEEALNVMKLQDESVLWQESLPENLYDKTRPHRNFHRVPMGTGYQLCFVLFNVGIL